MENTLNTAMLFAAGLGTRLKPFTNHHPKALAVVNGKTLLQRNIEYLTQFGITNIVVNVHHFASQIIDTLHVNKGFGANVIISNEEHEVLETGGGLQKAIPFFKNVNNIVVMNVDILTNLNISKMHEQHLQTNALATLAVTNRRTSRYLLFNKQNNLCGWFNIQTNETKGVNFFDEKAMNKMAFSGVQIISTNLFGKLEQQGKFSIIDVYLSLMKSNEIKAYNHSNDILVDVGKPESIIIAEDFFK